MLFNTSAHILCSRNTLFAKHFWYIIKNVTFEESPPFFGVEPQNFFKISDLAQFWKFISEFLHVIQSVANIFFWTEYEYEYIRIALLYTNTITNIFGIKFWTEYEYEYIQDQILDRIRIRIYSYY